MFLLSVEGKKRTCFTTAYVILTVVLQVTVTPIRKTVTWAHSDIFAACSAVRFVLSL